MKKQIPIKTLIKQLQDEIFKLREEVNNLKYEIDDINSELRNAKIIRRDYDGG